ncbi:MAG: hypothetical protein ACYC6Y_01290 [Thermoguttaceae bacterium]
MARTQLKRWAASLAAGVLAVVVLTRTATAADAPLPGGPAPSTTATEPGDAKATQSKVPPVPPLPPVTGTVPGAERARVAVPPAAKPPAAGPSRQTSPGPSMDQFAMRARGTPSLRLASVPNMLGDFSMFFQKANVDTNGGASILDMPLAGGGLRTKISENNKALPMDRVYFQYNHFHNSVTADFEILDPGDEFSGQTDRYTIGLEKTFRDGLWSVDVRMPFTTTESFSTVGVSIDSGNVGNLDVIFKRLLAACDHGAVAAGVGINTPTGSDVRINAARNYSLENEAAYLSPFVGALYQPSDRLFYQGFLEVDVPLNGNTLVYEPGTDLVEVGVLTEQTLLKVDLSMGYWFYRNPHGYVTGLASIVEFHYTGTLNDGDVVALGADRFGSLLNRFDLTNVTVGLHAELDRHTTLRVGGVLPLNEIDRAFDAEVQVSLNRYF